MPVQGNRPTGQARVNGHHELTSARANLDMTLGIYIQKFVKFRKSPRWLSPSQPLTHWN